MIELKKKNIWFIKMYVLLIKVIAKSLVMKGWGKLDTLAILKIIITHVSPISGCHKQGMGYRTEGGGRGRVSESKIKIVPN